jgi:hypothetical protein
MKRSALWSIALLLAAVSGVRAQGLTMQMSNGWMFTFTGNVNAFAVYTDGKVDAGGAIAGGLVPAEKVTRIRTGLLPGFAQFEASGKEGPLNLKVHFGFAPQIQTGGVHDNFGNGTQAGAQIDMREIYLTAGGGWGQILAGRALEPYLRQNILTDMTLFGTGASGGGFPGAGTTLGRIGFGYVYPNFSAQIAYSTPPGSPFQLTLAAVDPSAICSGGCPSQGTVATATNVLTGIRIPRFEAEATLDLVAAKHPGANNLSVWANGMVQPTYRSVTPIAGDTITTVGGAGAGIKATLVGIQLMGSGYWGRGLGTTLMFSQALDAAGSRRTSWGYIGQAQFTPVGSKITFGASYGISRLERTGNDPADATNTLVKYNAEGDGMITYQWTKALRWVFEYTWARSRSHAGAQTTSNQGTTGLMLFF